MFLIVGFVFVLSVFVFEDRPRFPKYPSSHLSGLKHIDFQKAALLPGLMPPPLCPDCPFTSDCAVLTPVDELRIFTHPGVQTTLPLRSCGSQQPFYEARTEHAWNTHGAHTEHTRSTLQIIRNGAIRNSVYINVFYLSVLYSYLQCAPCVLRVCSVCVSCVRRACSMCWL